MNVKLLKTGETKRVKDGYGLRLIEQGKAVFVREKVKKAPAVREAKKDEANGA